MLGEICLFIKEIVTIWIRHMFPKLELVVKVFIVIPYSKNMISFSKLVVITFERLKRSKMKERERIF